MGKMTREEYSKEGVEDAAGVQEAFSINTKYSQEQSVVVLDLISEGPIQGLVHGGASVFLNNDRIMSLEQSTLPGHNLAMRVTTNGTTTGTIVLNGQSLPSNLNPLEGSRVIVIRGVYSSPVTSLTVTKALGVVATDGELRENLGYSLTISSAILTAAMEQDNWVDLTAAGRPARLVHDVTGESIDGHIIKYLTTTTCTWMPGNLPTYGTDGVDITSSDYTLVIDTQHTVSSISGTTLTFSVAPTIPNATYPFDLLGGVEAATNAETFGTNTVKYKNATTQFRTGLLYQPPMNQIGQGTGPMEYKTHTASLSLQWTDTFGGAQSPQVSNLSSSDAYQKADEAKLIFTYTSLQGRRSNGSVTPAFATYRISVDVFRGNAWIGYAVVADNVVHTASSAAGVVFEETVDLTPFKPFEQHRIKIERKWRHDGLWVDQYGNNGGTDDKGQHDQYATCSLSSIIYGLKSTFNYPLSAYAGVTFSAKDFTSMPNRSYHCRGLLVQVPSNYVTREESTTGVASYNRNISTGAIESTYQDWDGSFRAKKVYTNNPAWVFYDIIVNKRYGLGSWITPSDIDKYALYRVARYCDELVSDGTAGTGATLEPRFTCNLYLTSAVDAYKVLKDMATVFSGMLYFLNGQLTTVIDAPSDPVMVFSKANVLDGLFNYESSGAKTRVNQIIVSWNDPDRDYELVPLIVEDTDAIISSGKVISDEAVAFGCTSEAQAARFGRWKLWTAKYQTELVSFTSALNAGFLEPGNVITVQDYSRNPSPAYSGRVGSGTVTTTQVALDRSITMASGSTFELSILINSPAAFLAQDGPVTINSVVYNRGDLVPEAYIDHDNNLTYTLQAIDSEADARNAKATAGATEALILSWAPYTRVETRPVTTSTGSPVSSLTVSPAFSETPQRETVWALKGVVTASGAITTGSAKDYKILTISESGKNLYDIIAVEHSNAKFDYIDGSLLLEPNQEATTSLPVPKSTDVVPPVPYFYTVVQPNLEEAYSDIYVSWVPPFNLVQPTVVIYPNLGGFLMEHNIPGYPTTIALGKDERSYVFKGIPKGTYKVSIRAVNTRDNKSLAVYSHVTITSFEISNVQKGPFGTPVGGSSNKVLAMSAAGTFGFSSYDFYFSTPQEPFTLIRNTTNTSSYFEQICTGMNAMDFLAKTPLQAALDSSYILFDHSIPGGDRFRLLRYVHDTSNEISYWYDTGTGANTTTETETTIRNTFDSVGTFSAINAGVNTIVGVGTSWNTAGANELKPGNVIRFASDKYARVVHVYDNTNIIIDRVFKTYTAGGTVRRAFRVDPSKDCLVARVWRDTTLGYQATVWVDTKIDAAPTIVSANAVTQGFVYYTPSSASAPSTPSATSYNHVTRAFTGLTANWSINPPLWEPGSTAVNKYWYSPFVVTGAGVPTFSTVAQGVGFSGLVTFSNNSYLGGGQAAADINLYSTTIDGGKITTDTITLNKITSSVHSNFITNLSFGLGAGTQFGGSYGCGLFETNNSSYWGLIIASDGGKGALVAAVTGDSTDPAAGFYRYPSTLGTSLSHFAEFADDDGNWAAYIGNGTDNVTIGGSNAITITGDGTYTGTWTDVSDLKFKNVLNPIVGALKSIMSLAPAFTYSYNELGVETLGVKNKDKILVGYSAQDFEEKIPLLIEESTVLIGQPGPEQPTPIVSDPFLTLNYEKLTVYAVEAIKELAVIFQLELDKLKTEIEELKKTK